MNAPTLEAQIEAARFYESVILPAAIRQWAPKVADAAKIQPGERLLDVACGTGLFAREILSRAPSVARITGVDLNPGMIAVANQLAPSVEWREGAAESLPFPNESFDVVVSQFGLMFFTDRAKAIREMVRVLVPGGRVVIAVWDRLENMPGFVSEVELVERTVGKQAADTVRVPFSLGDRKELAALFSKASMERIEINTHQGTARYPDIRSLIEPHLKGRVRQLGIILNEDQINDILRQGEKALGAYITADGRVVFPVSAHVLMARKP